MGVYSNLNRMIVVVDYDPRWPGLFEAERERLLSLLGDRLVEVQHIGSTAIPGLAAKPVIDIAVGFEQLQDGESCLSILENAGYSYEAELNTALPDRRFLWRVNPTGQRYHLHLASLCSRLWTNPIAFRDYVLRHPEAASEYGRLKEALAENCGSDISAYIDGKASFVEQILELAKVEAALSGKEVEGIP